MTKAHWIYVCFVKHTKIPTEGRCQASDITTMLQPVQSIAKDKQNSIHLSERACQFHPYNSTKTKEAKVRTEWRLVSKTCC